MKAFEGDFCLLFNAVGLMNYNRKIKIFSLFIRLVRWINEILIFTFLSHDMSFSTLLTSSASSLLLFFPFQAPSPSFFSSLPCDYRLSTAMHE
jgi:hypothetical protein